MLLKEEAEVAHIKSGSQGEIGNVLRISHDAHATKIVIYMILLIDRTTFFTILPAENPVLSESATGATPENEQGKTHLLRNEKWLSILKHSATKCLLCRVLKISL